MIKTLSPFHTGKILSKVDQSFLSKVNFHMSTFLCERSTFESLSLAKVTFTKWNMFYLAKVTFKSGPFTQKGFLLYNENVLTFKSKTF